MTTTGIREIAERYIGASDARTAEHHARAARVADWESKNGEFDLQCGGEDYWNHVAWQQAYRRYFEAFPDDAPPMMRRGQE